MIADHLAEAIETAGGDIRLRYARDRIHVADGRGDRRHVREQASRHDARRGAGGHQQRRPEAHRARAGGASSTSRRPGRARRRIRDGAAALRRLPRARHSAASDCPTATSNRWSFADYDFDGEYAMAERGEMPEHPFLYIATASPQGPGAIPARPPGHTQPPADDDRTRRSGLLGRRARTSCATAPTRPARATARQERRITQRMIAAGGARRFPGSRAHVVFQEAATPLTHTRYTGSTGGTSYGIAATPAQFLARPAGARDAESRACSSPAPRRARATASPAR